MDEHEPEEQFEATDYDEDGNIKLPPPPLAAAKPKRMTVAELSKIVDELCETLGTDVHDRLHELDVKLDELKADVDDSVLGWLGELAVRLDKIEEFNKHSAKAFELLLSNFEERNKQIDELMQSKATVDIKEPAATPQPPEPEIEFAQPPQQRAGWSGDVDGIAATASVCQHMTDVLMITRALKEIPELTDAERNGILNIACRSSGVIITPGLQIRAGVQNVEA